MSKKSKSSKTDRDGRESEETVDEFERRWIVLSIDPDIGRYPSKEIEQGYFDGSGDLRVRITDGKQAELTRKTGKGRARQEHNRGVSLETGRFMLEATSHRLEKRRHLREGWEVDHFHGPLAGLVIAEIEKPTLEELDRVTLPPWIHSAIEVTGSLSNRMLARIAYDLRGETPAGPVRDLLVKDVPKIVLTGGPCSGKSSVMAALRSEFSSLLHCVPEVATIVIEQVGIKPPVGDRLGMKAFQRTIYRVQLGFEKGSNMQALRDGRSALLLDRGTVDGAAYMERGIADMEQVFRTTLQDEYDRYRGVICLDVPPQDVYEANKGNNPARYETYEQAAATGRRIHEVWNGHPNFRFIRSCDSWDDKLQRVRSALNDLLNGE